MTKISQVRTHPASQQDISLAWLALGSKYCMFLPEQVPILVFCLYNCKTNLGKISLIGLALFEFYMKKAKKNGSLPQLPPLPRPLFIACIEGLLVCANDWFNSCFLPLGEKPSTWNLNLKD